MPTLVSTGPLEDDQLLAPKTFISKERHSNTSPEDSGETWDISVEQAKMTLDATTQRHVIKLLLVPKTSRSCIAD